METRTVVVGRKATSNYSLAVVYLAAEENVGSIRLVARGRLTSKAIDAALQATTLVDGSQIISTQIRTEKHQKVRVSIIEIEIKVR